MIEFAAYVACAVGIALPTIPGLIQLRSLKKDAMTIDQRYTRDPRYLGASWRRTVDPILQNATSERVEFLKRKNEFAQISNDTTLPNGAMVTDVLLSRGSFRTGKQASLVDVYAKGAVQIGSDSHVRCLAADGSTTIGDRTVVTRWLDVAGDLHVGRFCDLGASASATGTLTIGSGTRFRRLFATPVAVAGDADAPATVADKRERRGSTLVIRPGENVPGDIIVPRDVEIGNDAVVNGSITAGGDVRIGSGARVQGNVIARGNATVGQRATVLGHIFSDRSIAVASAATVGNPHYPKTVQSAETLQLAPGATVYGWAICERGGTAVVIGA
jgi:predicted acyltransferase (DUF342 family)